MRRLLTGLIIIVSVAAVWAPAAEARTFVVDGCAAGGVRPAVVTIFCGDNGLSFQDLQWSSFGGRVARARGTKVQRTCVPDCASGGVRRRSAKLVFSHREHCAGHPGRYYTRVRSTTANATRHYEVPCPF